MDKSKEPLTLNSPGLNQNFQGEHLSFDDYIALMRNIITKSRNDLTSQNAQAILLANSPFSWEPSVSPSQPIKNGILLVHGLFDSPYYVQDIGKFFLNQGFLVRAILLPGHGTLPSDLLNIDYHEWIKAVRYGIETLANDVENIYLAGYSLGGTLAIHQVLAHACPTIKALLLFAPAIKPKSKIKNLLVKYHSFFSWIHSRTQWFQLRKPNNYAKYSSYATNAAKQACAVIEETHKLLKKKNMTLPCFIVLSQDDETISYDAIIKFFEMLSHPKNKLLIYTNHCENSKDPRIVYRLSAFPQAKILNFSHSCIMISPDNPYLGKNSEFFDLNHYPETSKIDYTALQFGAATKENLKRFKISRLSYNPDFENLLENINLFIQSIPAFQQE